MEYTRAYWDDVRKVVEVIPNMKKLYNRSVFLTGGTGLIGSSIADLLFYLNKTRNAEIKIFLAGRSIERFQKRFKCFIEGVDYTFVQYDAAADNPVDIVTDYIIHGAGNAGPTMFRTQPVETMFSNILGLKRLLDMALQNHAKRILYISSSEVYGQKNNNEPYREEDYGFVNILNPRAAYPSSKRAAETMCAAYGAEFDVDTVVVRPGHIYGPSITDTDDRASAQFTRSAVHGEDIVMKSPGTQLRSYCYCLDCASAILTVLINGERGQAYNISNKDSIVSIRDVAEALANVSGVKVLFSSPSDTEKAGYNFMENSALEASKLEMLGWKATFDLQTGVEKTVRIMRHQIER